VSVNSLAGSLSLYARLRGRPISEEDLLAGLPVVPQPDGTRGVAVADVIKKAAERAGLLAQLKKGRLTDISAHALPVILLFNNGTTCLLTNVAASGECTVLLPESELIPHQRQLTELGADYTGFLIYLGEKSELPQRDGIRRPGQSGSHWFWHAIWLCAPVYFDVIVASFIISIFALVSPLFTMNVYDRVVPNNAIETLWVLGIATIVVTLFDSILKFIRTYYTELAAKKSDMLISARVFEKILNLRMEEAPRNVGAFASSLREYDSIRNFLTSSVMLILPAHQG